MLKIIFGNPVRLMEFVAVSLFLLTMLTQIVIPLLKDSTIFPIFSRKPRIKKDIAKVNEEQQEEQLLAELEEGQERLRELRRSREQKVKQEPEKPETKTGRFKKEKS